MMKLYGAKASPFVQRALMVGRLKGHEVPLEFPLGGDMKSPAFLEISPLGRIPVLEHDGWTVAESAAIAAYLDEVLDGPSLLPANPRERARMRQLESLVACELSALRAVMTGPVFGMPVPEALIEAAREQARGGFAAIERVRNAADALAIGAAPSLADCALFPVLVLLEIADPFAGTSALLDDCPGLRAYRAMKGEDPVIGRSAREMHEGFAAIFAHRRATADA